MGSSGVARFFLVLCNLWLTVQMSTLPGTVGWSGESNAVTVPVTARSIRRTRTILQAAEQVVCPLDFSILNKYTWITDDKCEPAQNLTTCCVAVLSSIGLSISQYLRETGLFELENAATVDVCLNSFQSQLRLAGVQLDVVTQCFKQRDSWLDYSLFIRSPSLCQGIQTVDDFRRTVGVTSMENSCKSNLKDPDQCRLCVEDLYPVISQLHMINASTSSGCFNHVVLYAAGVVNVDGPWNEGTAFCVFDVFTGLHWSPARKKVNLVGLYVGLAAGLISLAAGVAFWYWWRAKASMIQHEVTVVDQPRVFTYKELSKATKSFSRSELLGSGGFGAVYKATLPSGAQVAVKRMRNDTSKHGIFESFHAEVASLSHIRHRNLVQLRGWCHDEEHLLLVYNYMSNGSLDDWLFKQREPESSALLFPLHLRHSVLTGIAAAIAYLHQECPHCVLHRDIKSSNVLLDGEWNAYLGDFGLARVLDHQKMEKTTLMAGTFGYIAPEMAHTGKATTESDVYSFGVLMLEVMCGTRALDVTAIERGDGVLVDRVWRAHEADNILQVADSRLSNAGMNTVDSSVISMEMIAKLLHLGLLCCNPNPEDRPSMRLVSQLLQSSEHMESSLPPLPEHRQAQSPSSWPGFSQGATVPSSSSSSAGERALVQTSFAAPDSSVISGG